MTVWQSGVVECCYSESVQVVFCIWEEYLTSVQASGYTLFQGSPFCTARTASSYCSFLTRSVSGLRKHPLQRRGVLRVSSHAQGTINHHKKMYVRTVFSCACSEQREERRTVHKRKSKTSMLLLHHHRNHTFSNFFSCCGNMPLISHHSWSPPWPCSVILKNVIIIVFFQQLCKILFYWRFPDMSLGSCPFLLAILYLFNVQMHRYQTRNFVLKTFCSYIFLMHSWNKLFHNF